VLPGINVPLPPDQIPPVAATTLPFKVTVGNVAHKVWFGPALAVIGDGKEVTVTVAEVGGQSVASPISTVYVPTPTEIEEVDAPVLH